MVAAGLAVALGAGWHWLAKVRHIAHEQQVLDRALDQRWASGPTGGATGGTTGGSAGSGGGATGPGGPDASARGIAGRSPLNRVSIVAPARGAPIARLYLPTLGQTLVVVEGAGAAELMKGPGRMSDTVPLGEPGNTALAGHRYPGVFWDLDRIAAGDPIVVETADAWLVYRTVRTVIVEPADDSVLAAPGGAAADAPVLLTLITCEPRLSTVHRLVKQAVQVRVDPHDAARPRELSTPRHR
jgi:LPXTG-site transpeptidase (sortase) family protein